MPAFLAPFLLGMAGPVAWRVLASLGFGLAVWVGYNAVLNSLLSEVNSFWGSMPADMLAYLTLAGFSQGLGIILGALTAKIAIITLPKISFFGTAS